MKVGLKPQAPTPLYLHPISPWHPATLLAEIFLQLMVVLLILSLNCTRRCRLTRRACHANRRV